MRCPRLRPRIKRGWRPENPDVMDTHRTRERSALHASRNAARRSMRRHRKRRSV